MIGDARGLTLGLVVSQCVVGCAVFAFLLAARAARGVRSGPAPGI
jgi:hypothetical protein